MMRMEEVLACLKETVGRVAQRPPLKAPFGTAATYSDPPGGSPIVVPPPRCSVSSLSVVAALSADHELFWLIKAVPCIAQSSVDSHLVAQATMMKLVKSINDAVSLVTQPTAPLMLADVKACTSRSSWRCLM
eukprot:Polyplicarium_translucidae@DN4858_c0_g1_i1.p1